MHENRTKNRNWVSQSIRNEDEKWQDIEKVCACACGELNVCMCMLYKWLKLKWFATKLDSTWFLAKRAKRSCCGLPYSSGLDNQESGANMKLFLVVWQPPEVCMPRRWQFTVVFVNKCDCLNSPGINMRIRSMHIHSQELSMCSHLDVRHDAHVHCTRLRCVAQCSFCVNVEYDLFEMVRLTLARW